MPLIQILSDTHLETHPSYTDWRPERTPASYIGLLGDIGEVSDPGLFGLFTELLDQYSLVLYLLGNHDAGQYSMDAAKRRIRDYEARMAAQTDKRTIGRFVFLDQTRYDVTNSVTILGCTLYTHVPQEHMELIAGSMIEFNPGHTPGWTVEYHNAAHAGDVAWLNFEVEKIEREEPHRQIVIFSHHSPTVHPSANDPKHKGNSSSFAYRTDLSTEKCWTSAKVRLWAFGHTHFACDFHDGIKKVVSNPKGYKRRRARGFDARGTWLLPDGQKFREPSEVHERESDSTRSLPCNTSEDQNSNHVKPKSWLRRTLARLHASSTS